MDEEVMMVGEEKVVMPPEPPVPVEQPKKAKPLKLLAGIAIILVAVALGLTMLGGNKGASTPTNNSNPTTPTENKYQNKEYFYELTLPPKWQVQPTSAETQSMNFTTSGDAIMTVKAVRQQGDLEAYLTTLTGIKVNKSNPVRVGGYDGLEQQESWTSQGIQVTSAYVKIQDMIYSLTLLPTGGKNSVTNESLIREYKSVLASFRVTDTAALGKDWVAYTSPTTDTSLSRFELQYPQSWRLAERSDTGILVLKIYKDDYQIEIEQGPFDGGFCLFDDSPSIEDANSNVILSEDLRKKTYFEMTTEEGILIRRYFKNNVGDKSVIAFCMKKPNDEQYESIWQYGLLSYRVPAKYDNDILLEMDSIVKTMRGIDNE